ncbi:MAG TPA: SDR family oxidoreductase [Acetobacteraceae bacterium]|nr:SDR family oxidoreductase [Acetobacteraceae bacterium]
MGGLKGRIAWITGAGSGIGRAIALTFAGAGAQVALTGRTEASLRETEAMIRAAGGTVLLAPADVTDAAAVRAAHDKVAQAWGHPDILVNNAGSNVGRRHWKNLGPEGAAEVIDVNLKAPFLCSLAVLPAMRAKGGGMLIHIASLAGTAIHAVSGPSYTAAKHGAVAMSATINAEEGIHGIRSVCICPGEVATPILDKRPAPPSAEDRALMVQPDDIAAAALFCATLPPRACVTDLVIVPTDNHAHRATARAIDRMPDPA